SNHSRMGGKLSRHLGCNRKRETPVGLVGGIGEASTSRAQLFAFLVYLDHVWILHRQPWRGSRGRSSKNHGDVIPMKNVHRPLQPSEIELALGGLHQCPGKLRDADIREAGFGNLACIFFPQRFGCLVRIVINAQQERPSRWVTGSMLRPYRQPKACRPQHHCRGSYKLTPIQFSHDASSLLSSRAVLVAIDECARPNLHQAQGESSISSSCSPAVSSSCSRWRCGPHSLHPDKNLA